MSIAKHVRELMSVEGCGVFPVEEVRSDKLLFDLGFDSLRFMELVVLIEETFAISFPDQLLEVGATTTVSDIVSAVEGCLKGC